MSEYTFPAVPGEDTCSFTIPDLPARGRRYRARVAAVNDAGQGPWSQWSNVVMPLPGPASLPDPFARPRGEATTPRELAWGSWNAWQFGEGTPWEITGANLATMPAVRTGDTARGQQDGDWPGADRSEARTITVDLRTIACRDAARVVDDLVYATPIEQAERELLVNGRWTIFCRARRREIPQEGGRFGTFLTAALQWVATDPRIYGEQLSSWAALANYDEDGRLYAPTAAQDSDPIPSGWAREYAMPGDPAGSEQGWTYPGEARMGGLIVAANDGRRRTWRIGARISGPCLDPELVHVQRQERLEFRIELLQGQAIELDWWQGTVLMEDRSRYLALTARSRWWPLEPGLNTIRFLAARYDAGARCDFWWRPAW